MSGTSRNRVRANRLIGNGFVNQGSNFGIGSITAANTGNVIEENTSLGNVIGILVAAGVQGETVRRNVALGNPPMQVGADYASGAGGDIVNRAAAGANTFLGNVCLTAVNAPCPAPTPPSLTASPNPVALQGAALLGATTLSWSAPSAQFVEIRVAAPNGDLLARGGSRGSATTGPWVADGTTFYLQDVTGDKALTADNTLATIVVRLRK